MLFSGSVMLTFCDPMDCSTPGSPVLQYLLELAQTHVHGVSAAIQPSHPLSPPFLPALSLSQHQDVQCHFLKIFSNRRNLTFPESCLYNGDLSLYIYIYLHLCAKNSACIESDSHHLYCDFAFKDNVSISHL